MMNLIILCVLFTYVVKVSQEILCTRDAPLVASRKLGGRSESQFFVFLLFKIYNVKFAPYIVIYYVYIYVCVYLRSIENILSISHI